MIRSTSKEAYKNIVSNGTLTWQKQLIVDYLMTVEDSKSLREIQSGIEITTGKRLGINIVSGRVNELKNTDPPILIECAKRPCTITGITITPLTCQYGKKYQYDKNGQGSFI